MQGPLGGAASLDCAVLAQSPMAVGRGRAQALLPGIAPSGHALADPAPCMAGRQVHLVKRAHTELVGVMATADSWVEDPFLQGIQGSLHRLVLATQELRIQATVKPQSLVLKLLREASTFQQTAHQTSISKTSGLHPQKQYIFSSWLQSANHAVGTRLCPLSDPPHSLVAWSLT